MAKKTEKKTETQDALEAATALYEALYAKADGVFLVGVKAGDHRIELDTQSPTAFKLILADLSASDVVAILSAIGVSLAEEEEAEEEAEEEEAEEEEAEEEEAEEDDEEEEAEEDDDEEEAEEEEVEEEEVEDLEVSDALIKKAHKCKAPAAVAKLVASAYDEDSVPQILEFLRDEEKVPALKGLKDKALKALL